MAEMRFVFCALSAFVGAGFASGREMMQFFTRFGGLAVPLILLSGAAMTVLMGKCTRAPGGMLSGLTPVFRVPVLLLLLCTGGGMAAAAGEIFALTLPIHHARTLGTAFSLLLCLFFSLRPVKSLSLLSCLLLPFLLFALFLCLRVPGAKASFPLPGALSALKGGLGALAYAGMNALLASGVLCDAGESCGVLSRRRGAAWAGGALTALMLMYHCALFPHRAALEEAALPLVMLLKNYGVEGYYLSAAVLYFSIITTLIAVLRSLKPLLSPLFPRHDRIFAGLLIGLFSLAGFENIVAFCYPALGLCCFFLLIATGRRWRTGDSA